MKKVFITILIMLIMCQTAYAGTYMFRDKASRIARWLAVKGHTGTVYDALISYFSDKSGLTGATLYDNVNQTMLDLGYNGTIRDKLDAFFIDTTSVTGAADAERAFWANDSYDFGTGTGPSGDALLLETGDFILLETGDYLLLQ